MRILTTFAIILGIVLSLSATPALAHDHVVNAARAPGAQQRGFGVPTDNPGDPVGKSGGKASPAKAPGGGDPKVSRPGNEALGLGTPASTVAREKR